MDLGVNGMSGDAILAFTLFRFFRRVLVIIVLTYSVVRLVSFIWTLHVATSTSAKHRTLRRYLVVSLLQVELVRFWRDFLQIAALALILWWLVSVHV